MLSLPIQSLPAEFAKGDQDLVTTDIEGNAHLWRMDQLGLYKGRQLGKKTSHYAIFSPGNDNFAEQNYPGTWEYQLQYAFRWLTNIFREINSTNKWDRLYKEIAEIKINYENDEGKFSATEYEELKHKIDSLKNGITSINLLPEQLAAINTKLDHLTLLAKDMNKFDWKGLFVGTIISIIVQLSVTPENAKSLWALIKQVFSNYLLP